MPNILLQFLLLLRESRFFFFCLLCLESFHAFTQSSQLVICMLIKNAVVGEVSSSSHMNFFPVTMRSPVFPFCQFQTSQDDKAKQTSVVIFLGFFFFFFLFGIRNIFCNHDDTNEFEEFG